MHLWCLVHLMWRNIAHTRQWNAISKKFWLPISSHHGWCRPSFMTPNLYFLFQIVSFIRTTFCFIIYFCIFHETMGWLRNWIWHFLNWRLLISRKGYQIFHLIVHKRKYTLNRSINGMHGYDKYCQKRYSIIENYDAIARFVYSEYMQDSASSAWLTLKSWQRIFLYY